MSTDIGGIRASGAASAAGRAAPGGYAVDPVVPAPDATARAAVPQQSVPQQSVPSTAAALPVAETALRRVLASQGQAGPGDATATALDLLRSVEALLRASAPAGTPPEEIGAAAARLVERQGLLARLTSGASAPPPAHTPWEEPVTDSAAPAAVDTRL